MYSILCFPTNAQTKTWIFLCKSINTDKIAFLSKNSAEGQILDQYQYLGNYPLTPPLTQH